jgi:hypothetical protein
MDVDVVEQRAGDELLVFCDGGGGASAGFLAVVVIAVGAGIITIAHFFHAG